MKYALLLSLAWLTLPVFSLAQQPARDVAPLSIGHTQWLQSDILKEERRLNIYLPPGLDTTATYPVLYLLDGSMHEDFMHICGLLQFFNLQFKMPPAIVVGIANVDRKRDFTFQTYDQELLKDLPTAGGSAPFIRFMAEELQPFIEKHYPANTERYLIGQSLGGLLASEILLRNPQLFSHYFIISPSLWWDDESLLDEAPALLQQQQLDKLFVYLSVGGEEHPVMVKDAKRLFKVLREAQGPGFQLQFNLMPEENHATILHQSIYDGLLHLFPYQEE